MERKSSRLDIGDHLIGSKVWVKVQTEELFKEVKVKSIQGSSITVELDNQDVVFKEADCYNSNVGTEPSLVSDLAKMTHANEATCLDAINQRYMQDEIYTYAGRLLVVINPFKSITGLYDKNNLVRYQSADVSHGFPTELPPHTYAVAQLAMNTLKITQECQSCVVSGESGAGKTETARHLMQYFATSRGISSSKNNIQDIILGANPLLEALGNAKTTRNNNSSRFGRFVKLDIPEGGGLCGGIISNYMLEISRIEFQSKDERNFHIFYQIIKSLPSNEKSEYKLLDMQSYSYLNQSGCYDVATVNDIEEFRSVKAQLQLILSNEEIQDFYRVLSSILRLGNIQFENIQSMGTDRAASIKNMDDFKISTDLLGISADETSKVITVSEVTVGGSTIESALSSDQAKTVINAFAKETYSICFDFLIKKVNSLIQFDEDARPWIGILDIYGFEFFEKNSFEQFLINYANEKLQQFFIQQVFQAEKAEYEAEGIDHSMITYSDNAEVIQVFDKPKCSILAFLEEQCLLQTGTSTSFTQACHKNIKSEYFVELKGDVRAIFKVIHTASPVTYNTEEFVAKNKHKLPNQLIQILKNARNKFLNSAVSDVEVVESKNMRGKFVGSKFQKSMGILMTTLKKTNAHFIRCIKPNTLKQPRIFQAQSALSQMISLSVFEAIGIIHKGFAYRATFEDFVRNHQVLMNIVGAKSDSNDKKQACLTMLERIGVPKTEWQLGNTKLFIRKEGWLLVDRFLRQIMSKLGPFVLKLQSIYRAKKNRLVFNQSLEKVVRFQSLVRALYFNKDKRNFQTLRDLFFGVACFSIFSNIRALQNNMATIIQKVYRGYTVRKRYKVELQNIRAKNLRSKFYNQVALTRAKQRWKNKAIKLKKDRCATKIQAFWRGYKDRKLYKTLLMEKRRELAAIFIQKNWRGYVCRRNYAFLKLQRQSAIVIQKLWRGYQVRNGSKCPEISEKMASIRKRLKESFAISHLQNRMRTFYIKYRIKAIINTALKLQSFAQTKLKSLRLLWSLWATVKIQAFWRSYVVQRTIKEEKIKIILASQNKLVQKWNNNEGRMLDAYVKDKRENSKGGLCLVDIVVHVTPDTVYPKGWVEALFKIYGFSSRAEIQAIGVGAFHTIVATTEGQIYSFGLNDRCQLGLPVKYGMSTPRYPLFQYQLPMKILEISCGVDHTLMLTSEFEVYSWGSNRRGQCGNSTYEKFITKPSFVIFSDVHLSSNPTYTSTSISRISAGAFHNTALDFDNHLFIWGRGDHINLEPLNKDLKLPLPISLDFMEPDSKIVSQILCGVGVTYLINDKGSVYSFGNTINGQLGYTRQLNDNRIPKRLAHLECISSLKCGPNFTLALSDSSDIYIFGTFHMWSDRKNSCVKGTSCPPVRLNLNKSQSHQKPIDIEVGWWEASIKLRDSSILAWDYFLQEQRDETSQLTPVFHRINNLGDSPVNRYKLLTCPFFTAYFAEFGKVTSLPSVSLPRPNISQLLSDSYDFDEMDEKQRRASQIGSLPRSMPTAQSSESESTNEQDYLEDVALEHGRNSHFDDVMLSMNS